MFLKNKKFLILLVVLIGSLFIFQGCNIFGWLYPGGSSGSSESLTSEGEAALQNGDVDNALKYYADAVSKDTKNSEARWGYVKAYVLNKNVDLIMIASKMNAGEDPADIISSSASSLVDTMNTIVTYLDPIAHGSCDGVISQYDFNVNLNLMLAYMIRGLLKNGDSNNDNNYFSATGPGGGDVLIFDNGDFTYNSKVVDIEGLQDDISQTLDDIVNGMSSGGGVSRTAISNLLYYSHNTLEDMMNVYFVFGSSFHDFSQASWCLNNGLNSFPSSEVVEDLKKQADDRYTEMADYLNGADEDTGNLNKDHFKLVGVDMAGYDGSADWYANFTKSDWPTHSPTSSSPQNLYYQLSTHSEATMVSAPTFTNGLRYVQSVTNEASLIMQHIENANLLNNLMGGF